MATICASASSGICCGSISTPSGYQQISRTWLFAARESWTLPVLSRGLLYVSQNSREVGRGTDTRLLCYDMRA